RSIVWWMPAASSSALETLAIVFGTVCASAGRQSGVTISVGSAEAASAAPSAVAPNAAAAARQAASGVSRMADGSDRMAPDTKDPIFSGADDSSQVLRHQAYGAEKQPPSPIWEVSQTAPGPILRGVIRTLEKSHEADSSHLDRDRRALCRRPRGERRQRALQRAVPPGHLRLAGR